MGVRRCRSVRSVDLAYRPGAYLGACIVACRHGRAELAMATADRRGGAWSGCPSMRCSTTGQSGRVSSCWRRATGGPRRGEQRHAGQWQAPRRRGAGGAVTSLLVMRCQQLRPAMWLAGEAVPSTGGRARWMREGLRLRDRDSPGTGSG